ncbi:MAG TPA: hypothetical protein VES73_05945 [Lamprocystis sp. (in: g-proteobacteria)]|nr:hypothetical protein [Lamprocystis sp. (in: g-proteobacteria)]
MKWLVMLLLAINLGLFLWGWSQDAPINTPPPPVTAAPGLIRLLSEPLPTAPEPPPNEVPATPPNDAATG